MNNYITGKIIKELRESKKIKFARIKVINDNYTFLWI